MRVLVTRPKEDAERIAAPLRALGATVANEPMLVIMPVAGPSVDLDDVQAVLLTSANGARALSVAVDRRDVPVYAVGDQTARAAREQGFVTVHSAQGDVVALAALVAEALDPTAGPLVHAAGSTRAGDLAGALAKHGFSVRVARLYDARPTAALSREVHAALADGAIDAAVFFSPRTAKIFVEHIRTADLTQALGSLTAYALSDAVARELAGLPFARVRVAELPTQESLLEALEADIRAGGPSPEAEAGAAPAGDAAADPEEETDGREAAGKETDEGTSDEGTSAEGTSDLLDAANADSESPSSSEAGQDDRTHEDGDAVYGGSGGIDTKPKRSPDTQEQTERKAMRTLGKWVVTVLLVVAAGFGSLPWWKPLLPPVYQALLPSFPEPLEPPAIAELRVRLDTLTEDLAALQTQFRETSSATKTALRTARAGASSEAVSDLTSRLEALEEQMAEGTTTTPPAVPSVEAPELAAAISNAITPLGERLATVSATTATLRADLTALAADLSTLSEAVPRTDPRAVALLIQISLLRERITDGLPYADALAPVADAPTLGAKHDAALAELSSHADTGVPTLEALRRRFEPMSAEVARNAFVPNGQAWWKSTLASIMSSVTVRRTDGVPTDGTLGALSQAAQRIAENDLAGAVDALEALDDAAATAAADWMADARIHLAADAALASLTSAALEGIGAAQTTE